MERNIRTQAVVLSVRKYGELHKAVTLLSRDLGLIDAIIYGGRKGRKTALAPLFSVNDALLYFNPVKKEYSVVEAAGTFIPNAITQDLALTYTASFFCEIIARAASDESERAFDLLCASLEKLEKNPELRKRITISFIWKLMQISGTAPDLSACPVCERELSDDETLLFSTSLNAPCCKSCSDSDSLVLMPGSRRYLRYSMPMELDQAVGIVLNPAAENRILSYMLRWAQLFSQTGLRTLKDLSVFLS